MAIETTGRTLSMCQYPPWTYSSVGAAAAPSPPGEMAIFTVDAGLSPLVRLETGR